MRKREREKEGVSATKSNTSLQNLLHPYIVKFPQIRITAKKSIQFFCKNLLQDYEMATKDAEMTWIGTLTIRTN